MFPNRTLLLTTLITMLGAGCSGGEDRSQVGDRLRVAVSIQPQAWLVERVGGEYVEVITLLSPGDSPATYQPADAQISRVIQAKLYFRIGVPFESGQWYKAVQSTERLTIVDLREGIELHPLSHDHPEVHGQEPGEDEHEGLDPHIWLSPPLLKIQVRTVADALSRVDPEHGEIYEMNMSRLLEELDVVDSYIRERLSGLRRTAFYVFHPAWGYFAAEYGLQQEAIEIEGKDPSDREITEIQRRARRDGIRVIFVQPQISSTAVEALADAIGAEVRILDPLQRNVVSNLRKVADEIAEVLR